MYMKKHLFIFLGLFLISCSSYTTSSYSFSSTNTINSITSISDISSLNTVSTTSYYEKIEIIKIDNHHAIYKYGYKEIEYYADYIIDGEEFFYKNNLYINKTRNQIGFLVINKGRLILEETSFLKDGDAYEINTSLQYGKNSLITLIGEGSCVNFKSCAVSIFSKGSSMIHMMNGANSIAQNLDIVITDEYSCAYSFYNNDMTIQTSGCYVFIDNEKSAESMQFNDY